MKVNFVSSNILMLKCINESKKGKIPTAKKYLDSPQFGVFEAIQANHPQKQIFFFPPVLIYK